MKTFTNQPGLARELAKKPFGNAVMVYSSGKPVAVRSTEEARDILCSPEWPNRGARHADAVDTCLKVLDGHRSTIDARNAFIEAAREASILV